MILGVNQIVVKTSSGTTTYSKTVTPLCSTPATGCGAANPLVGFTTQDGDQAGTDSNNITGNGTTANCAYDVCDRPMFPSLFITDITSNASSLAGDWQAGAPQVCTGGTNAGKTCQIAADCPGGTCPITPATETTPIPPTGVFGTWKTASKALNKTTNPPTVTLTAASDPAKNDWNLGSGSDPVPKHCSITGLSCTANADCPAVNGKSQTCVQPADSGYGAEARWSVKALIDNGTLQTGHSYRLQFMVHDGDQNKTGGDTGENCVNLRIPGTLTNNCQ